MAPNTYVAARYGITDPGKAYPGCILCLAACSWTSTDPASSVLLCHNVGTSSACLSDTREDVAALTCLTVSASCNVVVNMLCMPRVLHSQGSTEGHTDMQASSLCELFLGYIMDGACYAYSVEPSYCEAGASTVPSFMCSH